MPRQKLPPLPGETLGERAAQFVAEVVGSWLFVGSMLLAFFAWMLWNLTHPTSFDPWPCILLGLAISIATICLEPIMLMTQNRAARQADMLALHDAQVNLEALRKLEAFERELLTQRLLLLAICARLDIPVLLEQRDGRLETK